MSFFIDRIGEVAGETITTRLPAIFDHRDDAIQAVTTLLKAYSHHGEPQEYGYWWAWDDGKQRLKFVVTAR